MSRIIRFHVEIDFKKVMEKEKDGLDIVCFSFLLFVFCFLFFGRPDCKYVRLSCVKLRSWECY